MSTISLDNVELILNAMIRRFRDKGIEEFSFDDEMYWNVSTDEFSSFPQEPDLIVGSLADDISFLNSLIEEDYITNFLELERLSTLFKFIAKQYSV
jgi:hypothetical protein